MITETEIALILAKRQVQKVKAASGFDGALKLLGVTKPLMESKPKRNR